MKSARQQLLELREEVAPEQQVKIDDILSTIELSGKAVSLAEKVLEADDGI